jgi:hypothetical protein
MRNFLSCDKLPPNTSDRLVVHADERADVSVGKFGAADKFLGDDLSFLLAAQLTAVAVELQAQVAAGAFVGAVNGADRVGAKAQLLGDGKALEAVDDLAVLVLNDGRVDALNPDGVTERVPLLRFQWRQQGVFALRGRFSGGIHGSSSQGSSCRAIQS